MVIINSDDFGASPEINLATYRAFKEGLISSTTALVNFETGLEDAVSYVKSGKINSNSIGIHLNLTAGRPLTKKITGHSKLCDNGVFKDNRNTSNFKLDSYSKECIYEEFDAQIRFFTEKFGFLPNHIDSHQHVHTKWPVLQCVIRVAKENEIKSIRLSRNIRDSGNFIKKIYKTMINSFLRFKGFKVTDKFGDINEAIAAGMDLEKNYEIMVHVNLSKDDKKILDIDAMELEPKLTLLFNGKDRSIINYRELQTK